MSVSPLRAPLGSLPFIPLRKRIRWVTAVALVPVTLLGLSGALSGLAFAQPSALKWLVSAAAPAAALTIILSERPLTWIAASVVSLAPFAQLRFTVASFALSPYLVLCMLALAVATATSDLASEVRFSPGRLARRSSLAAAYLPIVLLLLPAMIAGVPADVAGFALNLATALVVGMVCLRACATDVRAPLVLASAVVAAAMAQAALGIFEYRTGHRIDLYGGAGIPVYGSHYFFGYDGIFRPTGAFSDPISLGNMLAVALPFAFAVATSRVVPPVARVLNGVGGALIAAGLVLTLSRMSWIAAVVGVVAVVAVSPPAARIRQIGLSLGLVVLMQVSVIGLGGDALVKRFTSIADPTAKTVATAAGDRTRQEIWHAAWSVFTDHPLVGVGVGRLNLLLDRMVADSTIFTHAHSTYLQFLGEAGVLGGSALILLFLAAGRDLVAGLRGDGRMNAVTCGAAGSCAALAVTWLTDYVLHYQAVFACVITTFALAAALGRRSNRGVSR